MFAWEHLDNIFYSVKPKRKPLIPGGCLKITLHTRSLLEVSLDSLHLSATSKNNLPSRNKIKGIFQRSDDFCKAGKEIWGCLFQVWSVLPGKQVERTENCLARRRWSVSDWNEFRLVGEIIRLYRLSDDTPILRSTWSLTQRWNHTIATNKFLSHQG